jgi:signal transduction histidine kinase
MTRSAPWLAMITALAMSGAPLLAAENGTAEEAGAMLERAVAALKEDKDAALAAFSAGEEDFRDRDLYVFCLDPEQRVLTAHGGDPTLVGQEVPELRNQAGQRVDQELVAIAEDEFAEIEYLWPRPGETEPSEKVSYVTRVEDQVCGVGYYK